MAEDVKVDKDPIDSEIEKARIYNEKMKMQSTDPSTKTSDDDPNKITVDRQYIQGLREEAKEYRKKLESFKDEVQAIQGVLKQQFGVEDAKSLQDKLEAAKKAKEQEEEAKLSKLELSEKNAQKWERQLEDERIRHETRERDLLTSRNTMIIRNALIQAAVTHDVANPKQVLRLLEDEFEVDPNTLVPYYKAEDGRLSLEERVKVFLDDPDNWNLVRSKIPVGSGAQGGAGVSGKPFLSKEELSKLRNENPKEYKRRNAEIMQAYADKRVR